MYRLLSRFVFRAVFHPSFSSSALLLFFSLPPTPRETISLNTVSSHCWHGEDGKSAVGKSACPDPEEVLREDIERIITDCQAR